MNQNIGSLNNTKRDIGTIGLNNLPPSESLLFVDFLTGLITKFIALTPNDPRAENPITPPTQSDPCCPNTVLNLLINGDCVMNVIDCNLYKVSSLELVFFWEEPDITPGEPPVVNFIKKCAKFSFTQSRDLAAMLSFLTTSGLKLNACLFKQTCNPCFVNASEYGIEVKLKRDDPINCFCRNCQDPALGYLSTGPDIFILFLLFNALNDISDDLICNKESPYQTILGDVYNFVIANSTHIPYFDITVNVNLCPTNRQLHITSCKTVCDDSTLASDDKTLTCSHSNDNSTSNGCNDLVINNLFIKGVVSILEGDIVVAKGNIDANKIEAKKIETKILKVDKK